jgi:hypothetical protein
MTLTAEGRAIAAEGRAWGNCAVALANALDHALAAQRAYEATCAENQKPERERNDTHERLTEHHLRAAALAIKEARDA